MAGWLSFPGRTGRVVVVVVPVQNEISDFSPTLSIWELRMRILETEHFEFGVTV